MEVFVMVSVSEVPSDADIALPLLGEEREENVQRSRDVIGVVVVVGEGEEEGEEGEREMVDAPVMELNEQLVMVVEEAVSIEMAGDVIERSFSVHPAKEEDIVSFSIIRVKEYVSRVDSDVIITLVNENEPSYA